MFKKVLNIVASHLYIMLQQKYHEDLDKLCSYTAERFCDILLAQMAADVERRNQQLEESVKRIRQQKENNNS